MIKFFRISFILFGLMFSPQIGYAFTVYEVIERAVNNTPELRVLFEKKDQSIQNYYEQRSQYLPQIYSVYNKDFEKADPLTSSIDSSWKSYNKLQVMLEQRIFDVEQITKILSSAQAIQVQEFENQKLLESLIQLAIIAYYDVIQAEYITAIRQEYLRQVQEIEALTIDMQKQGDATLGEVNLVQARLAEANSELILAQSNLDKAKLSLAYLLDLVDEEQLIQSSEALPELTSKDFYDLGDKIINMIPVSPQAFIDSVLTNNIDILIFRSRLCMIGYEIEVQKSRYLPVVNLTGELKNEENRGDQGFTRSGKIAFEARYSIFDGGSRRAGVKKASSALKEAEYQYDILLRDTSDRAFGVFNILRSYEQQRLSVLKEIETVEEIDRVYNIQFQFATRSLIDRLDNLNRLSQSRAKLVQIDYNILSTRLEILLLMGTFVDFFGFQNYIEVSNLKLC